MPDAGDLGAVPVPPGGATHANATGADSTREDTSVLDGHGVPRDADAYDPARYGRAVEFSYDSLYPGVPETTTQAAAMLLRYAAAAVPTDLAGGTGQVRAPRILELGVGTGRLALPLVDGGAAVAGIEGSSEMLDQMRSKTGGDRVDAVVGDYRDALHPRGPFDLVALTLNGVFDPRGLQAQIDIFANARRHLRPGGFFVVESWVMSPTQMSGEWTVNPRYVGAEHVEFQLARYDVESNSIERTLMHLLPTGPKYVTVRDTYASPGQLDVIAHVTGFDRVARFADWAGTPFTSVSANQISIFRARS